MSVRLPSGRRISGSTVEGTSRDPATAPFTALPIRMLSIRMRAPAVASAVPKTMRVSDVAPLTMIQYFRQRKLFVSVTSVPAASVSPIMPGPSTEITSGLVSGVIVAVA